MNNIERFPEETSKLEEERRRTLDTAGEEANLRNEGLSPRKKVRDGVEETPMSVMQGDANWDNKDRDAQKEASMKVLHDFPGSIDRMAADISEGKRYDMGVFLFAHRSADTDEDKTKVYELYKQQRPNPFEGASRAKTGELTELQMEVEQRKESK